MSEVVFGFWSRGNKMRSLEGCWGGSSNLAMWPLGVRHELLELEAFHFLRVITFSLRCASGRIICRPPVYT